MRVAPARLAGAGAGLARRLSARYRMCEAIHPTGANHERFRVRLKLPRYRRRTAPVHRKVRTPGARPHYVQDALRSEATQVAELIRDGARVMVCGGRDMAAGVAEALAEILAPAGLTPAVLKAEGRYVEDVY